MIYKITPSLYSAWLFYAKPQFDRTEEQEKDARDEFIRALSKQSLEPSDAIRRGVLFEQMVTQAAKTGSVTLPEDLDSKGKPLIDPEKDDMRCALYMGEMLRGGVFQVKCGRELPSGHYIYGIPDVVLLNGIVDIKRVETYEMAKYQSSIQHWAYMYILGLKEFHYMACDGSPRPFVEPYTWFDGATGLLESRVCEMIHWINQDPELAELFAKHWTYEQPIATEILG